MTLLVSLRVLTGSWAWQVLCLNALATLGLSCRLTIFLMGKRILSIVMVLSLKSRTAPMPCKLCLPMIRSYRGALAPGSYSTISGIRCTDLLMEYSAKEISISPTFLVRKVPLEVPHDCGASLFVHGMYFWDPFLMKRRLPLDPVSNSTLIVLFLTISPLLTSLSGSLSPIWCNVAQFRCFFFEFSRLFDLIDNYPELEFCEMPKFLSKMFIMATTAVTLPVFKFSINFLLVLIISKDVLVALIGRVSLDVKLMPVGLYILKCLSTCVLELLYPLSYSLSELSLDKSHECFLEDFFNLDFLSFFSSFSSFMVR